MRASWAQEVSHAGKDFRCTSLLNLSFRLDVGKHGEANARVLCEAWMHKLQYLYDVCKQAQEPAYNFTLADLQAYVEPLAFTALCGSMGGALW